MFYVFGGDVLEISSPTLFLWGKMGAILDFGADLI